MTKTQKLIFEIVVAVLMIALLTGALVYYNAIDKVPVEDLEQGDDNNNPDQGNNNGVIIPTGYQVGFMCPTYDLQNVYDNNKTNVESLRGKVVVINFWYTTCGPCVAELPHFNELANNYQDEVAVVIVHAAFDFEDVIPYLDEHYPNTKMISVFDEAVPNKGDYYFKKLGGKDAYPKTVVLDKEGVVTKNVNGSIPSYSVLESYVLEAMA